MNYLQLFKQFLLDQKQNLSEATVKNYSADVKHFIAWLEKEFGEPFTPSKVSEHAIDLFRKKLIKKGLSTPTVKRHLSSIRKFSGFLKEKGFIQEKIVPQVEKPHQDKWHLTDFKDYLYVSGSKTITIKNYLADLAQFFTWVDKIQSENYDKSGQQLAKELPKLFEEYKKRLVNVIKLNPTSINRKLSSIRKYIFWTSQASHLSTPNQPISIKNLPRPQVPPQPVPPQKSNQVIITPPVSSFPPIRLITRTLSLLDDLLEHFFVLPATRLLSRLGIGTSTPTAPSTTMLNGIFNTQKGFENLSAVNKKFYQDIPKNKKYLRIGIVLTIVITLVGVIFARVLIPRETRLPTQAGQKQQQGPGQEQQTSATPRANVANVAPSPSRNRILTFEGRLTDSLGAPIASQTPVKFILYDQQAEGSLLWQEQNNINPDQNGLFSIILGEQTDLPVSVFTDYEKIWLGITVGTGSELIPRQQVPNVDLARNAQLLGGKSPSTQGNPNTVPVIDSQGNLNLGASSPTITATNGELTIQSNVLLLTTLTGSDGDIILSPDGLGGVDIQKRIFNSTGAVKIDDTLSITSSSSGSAALAVRQTGLGDLFNVFQDATSSATALLLTNSGSLGLGTATPKAKLDVTGTTDQLRLSYNSTNYATFNVSSTGDLTIDASGNDIIFADPINLGDLSSLTVSGAKTGRALAVFNETGNQNILVASASGITKLTINRDGNIRTVGDIANLSGDTLTIDDNLKVKGATLEVGDGQNATVKTSNARLTLDSGTANVIQLLGNVGIGSSSPGASLQVAGNSIIGYGASSITGPAKGLAVSGNVGIGTTSPNFKLEVAGSAHISGNTQLDGNITVNDIATFGSQVRLADGSNSTPALTFTNDTDTGLFRIDTNRFSLVTGGASALTIQSSGNVGIGTTNPGSTLQVSGNGVIGFGTGSVAGPINGLAVSGNVGIGTSSPSAKLEVAGGGRFNCSANFTNSGGLTSCSDVAELYDSEETLEKGDVLRIVSQNKVGKTTHPYDTVIGVYSTSPGLLVGNGAQIGNDQSQTFPNGKIPVGLVGRVPTKVSTENGLIEPGDFLTSSSTPGVAMKATKAGQVIGKALEGFGTDGNTPEVCPGRNLTSGVEEEAACDKILIFLNVSWYDPQPYLTTMSSFLITLRSTGEDMVENLTEPVYEVRDKTGKLIERVGVFSQAAVANLRAGVIQTKDLTVEASLIAKNATVEQMTVLSAKVEQLTVSSANVKSLVSPIAQIDELRTDLISPLASNSVTIHLGGVNPNTSEVTGTGSSDGGKLIVENAQGTEVASIDSEGNAAFEGEVTANELTVNELTSSDATVLGTLRAGKIVADDIEGLNAKIATFSATTITNNITNVVELATPSADLASQGETLEATEATPSAQLAQTETTTDGAFLDSILNNEFINPSSLINNQFINISPFSTQLAQVENLDAVNATFTQGLISYGLSSFFDISVSQTFSIGSNFILTEGSINVLGEDLALQNLRQGGVSIAGGLVYFDSDGNAKISGDLAVEGSLSVKGELATNIIKPIPDGDLVIQLAKTDTSDLGSTHLEGGVAPQSNAAGTFDVPPAAHLPGENGGNLIVKNASGSAILQVNQRGDLTASGSASFANLLSREFKIAREVAADISPIETEASASAGTATILAGQTKRTIITPFVKEDSLIYLTATSHLQGVYPSIAEQTPPSFTISIPRVVREDISINWLIIN